MFPRDLAHYRVIRPIGSGGMGEVYLAEDTRLGREVAIKLLAPDLATDADRRRRLEREARVIAALNHPNIVTIYSVEQHDGTSFLVMELVKGQTLTELIPQHGMSVDRLLQVAIPLTDAISVAHEQGVIHRDLKPSNIMVAENGHVKVLDFGLARPHDASVFAADATMTAVPLTMEGQVLGTVAYMSPEQAEGKPADPRSDVFSIGILLYEMAAGTRPFTGESPISALSAILRDTPAPLSELRADLPRDLTRIVTRCLAKNPEERYQTVKDVRNDLRLLQREIRAESIPGQRNAPGDATGKRRRRSNHLAIAATLFVGAAAVAAFWWSTSDQTGGSAPAYASFTMQRVTSSGDERLAAISPDGRYVAHVVGQGARPSLWIRQIGTGSDINVVPAAEGDYGGLTFSPDGQSVFYVLNTPRGVGTLLEVPLLGGTPQKLWEPVDTPPAFSPDGKRIAAVRSLAGGESEILVANRDGSHEHRLAARKPPRVYAVYRLAWSPNGKLIAAFDRDLAIRRSRIVLLESDTGREQPLGTADFDFPGQLAWLPDGSGLVFDAIAQGGFGANRQLWFLSYPEGKLRRITSDLTSYSSLDVTNDGQTILAIQRDSHANLWVVDESQDTTRARQISHTSHGLEGVVGIDWTRDGRVLYGASTNGSWDIWLSNSDGSGARPLTNAPGLEVHPQALPDGKTVVFISRPDGQTRFEVAAVDLDGGRPRVVTNEGLIEPLYLQAAEHNIYFLRLEGQQQVPYRLPVQGGTPKPVFRDPQQLPRGFTLTGITPDERLAVGVYADLQSLNRIAVVSIPDGRPIRTLSYAAPPSGVFGPSWTPSGLGVEHAGLLKGIPNIWRIPLDGRGASAITTFSSEGVLAYAWSRDGQSLAISRGSQPSDVVLISSVAAGR